MKIEIEYSPKEFKKNLIWVVVIFSIFLSGGLWLQDIWMILGSIIMTAVLLYQARKEARKSNCPKCNLELFGYISSLHELKKELNYCPCCGQEVNYDKGKI